MENPARRKVDGSMNIWGITDKGAVREQNQDSFRITRLPGGEALCTVCDGMGGARAGNVASTLAVDTFESAFLARSELPLQDRMLTAAESANRAIYRKAREEESCRGMGTTMVAVHLTPKGRALLLNVGDSRGYCIQESGIERITRDHSLVEDLLERGEITETEARSHPQKNLITRALGVEAHVRADFYDLELAPGAYLLLCSDGLSNTVNDQELLFEVLHDGTPETCCQRLLDISMSRGAPDNVTVVLIQTQTEV